jgi:transcriptional regulator with XRE-family HTH domain
MLREEKKISQQKLADMIGMTQSSVNDYENRGREPDVATLIRIADYFETSVDYVVAHTTIRRRIEEVDEFALNEQEAALVRGYRQLDAQSRAAVDVVAADMLRLKG